MLYSYESYERLSDFSFIGNWMYPIAELNYFLWIMSLGLPAVLYYKTNHVWPMTSLKITYHGHFCWQFFFLEEKFPHALCEHLTPVWSCFFHRKSLIWQKTSWPHSPLIVPPLPMAQTRSPWSTAGKLGTGVWLCGIRTDSEFTIIFSWKHYMQATCLIALQFEFVIWSRVIVLWIKFYPSMLIVNLKSTKMLWE